MIQAKRDRPAWPLFLIILFLGICFMLAVGQVAIQLVPTWSLIADVDSNINPNDQLAKWSGAARLEPVSAAILTQPAWRGTYLTPGASVFIPPIVMGIPTSTSETNNTPLPPPTQEPGVSITPGQPTAVSSSTPIIIIFPTNTSVPPTRTKAPTKVPTDVPTATGTATVTATVTATPTSLAFTETPTETATSTSVVVVDTETPTATVTPITPPPPCDNNVDLNTLSSFDVLKGVNCFSYTDLDPGPGFDKGGIFNIISTGVIGLVHSPSGEACHSQNINPGDNILYYAANSGGQMIFRINVTKEGMLNITASDWPASTGCP